MAMNEPVLVMDADEVRRAITRIAHEIIERNRGAEDLLIIGIQKKGVLLAKRIREALQAIEPRELPMGSLDISLHRDDYPTRTAPLARTEMPPVTGKRIILVDDVIFTGRSVRSALEAVMSFGRPASIQLAVLIDRGHRELPIRADYVGKNLPTSRKEDVMVQLADENQEDRVSIRKLENGEEG